MVSQYFTASDLHKCSVRAAKRTDTHSASVPLTCATLLAPTGYM